MGGVSVFGLSVEMTAGSAERRPLALKARYSRTWKLDYGGVGLDRGGFFIALTVPLSFSVRHGGPARILGNGLHTMSRQATHASCVDAWAAVARYLILISLLAPPHQFRPPSC